MPVCGREPVGLLRSLTLHATVGWLLFRSVPDGFLSQIVCGYSLDGVYCSSGMRKHDSDAEGGLNQTARISLER